MTYPIEPKTPETIIVDGLPYYPPVVPDAWAAYQSSETARWLALAGACAGYRSLATYSDALSIAADCYTRARLRSRAWHACAARWRDCAKHAMQELDASCTEANFAELRAESAERELAEVRARTCETCRRSALAGPDHVWCARHECHYRRDCGCPDWAAKGASK